jgi:subtilisin family serine protease
MKNKLKLTFAVLTVVLMLTALWGSAALAPPTRRTLFRYPYEEYLPDDYTAEAPNFEDYPADFSDGTVAWDLDLIDAEPEKIGYDGEGIYVAVLDTGLVANWKDFFPEERIATEYGIGFYENVHYNKKKDMYTYEGYVVETSFLGKLAHGTHVTSTIIGYSYYGQYVRGVAPKAKIIPVKVLDTYEGLGGDVFGTDLMVAAGINYVADLAESEGIKIIINMSIGAPEPTDIIEDAIDYAISKGVIIVAAAGNRGRPMGWPASPTGAPTWDWIMDWPGGYPQVISAGSCGWGMGTTVWLGMGEWEPWPQPSPRTWWYNDVPEDMEEYLTYISYFSSREYTNPDFPSYTVELDAVAPGSWVLGPYPGDTFGYQHIPWWTEGSPWNPNTPPPTYWYVGGTSMATPHISGVCALILQKNPTWTQAQVEATIKGTATPLPTIIPPNPFAYGYVRWTSGAIYAFLWAADATGAGIIQADAATS